MRFIGTLVSVARPLLARTHFRQGPFHPIVLMSSCADPCAKRALVVHPPGCEEMELITAVDVLRRGGVAVTLASMESKEVVKGGHDICIQSDALLSSVDAPFDAIVLPGGLPAAKAMSANAKVGELLRAHAESDRVVAAICAAPTVLHAHKVGLGKRLTSYPSVAQDLRTDYQYVECDVVVDGYLITSRGPATAQKFALKILECLAGKDTAGKVAKALLVTN